jgi:hypothetical protein
VTLPLRVYPGQKIEVRSPDGTRTIETIIPSGLQPGQTFLVKFPPISKKTLRLQGTLAQEREEAESERGGGECDDTPEDLGNAPSFVQVIENFFTPKPGEDVNAGLEKARKETEGTTMRIRVAPLPEGTRTINSRDISSFCDSYSPLSTLSRPENATVPAASSFFGDLSRNSTSVRSIVATHITKVNGEAVEATITPVSAEHLLTNESKSETTAEHDLNASSSFVKTLENFFTYKPVAVTSDHGKTLNKQSSPETFNAPLTSSTQKLIHVQVSPSLSPGSTIYVEIPGESRTVAAQVPPGVTSFHVAYTPQRPLLGDIVGNESRVGREKLLSVRVPPGTLPETTLHISVPDEPGRILAAQVPPGNIKKFHVSYIPREQKRRGNGMLPTASPYRNHYQGNPAATYHAQHYQARDSLYHGSLP